MRALIVGADHIRFLRDELVQTPGLGVTRTEHWTGRQPADRRRQIPIDTAVVVVVCDRINHELLFSVRRQADSRGVPVLYCRHSVVDLRDKLERLATRCGGECAANAGRWEEEGVEAAPAAAYANSRAGRGRKDRRH